MGKTPETLSSANQALPENKDLTTIDHLLETTLSFVENIVDNPGKTKKELHKQALSIIGSFEKLYKNNLELFSKFNSDEEYKLTGQTEEPVVLTEKVRDTIRQAFICHYINRQENNATIKIERSEKKIIISNEAGKDIIINPWQQVWWQRYQIFIKGNRFEMFKFFENVHNKSGLEVERVRTIKVNATYDYLNPDAFANIEINLELNPLKENEFFRGKPKAVKKKGLEIKLF